MNYIFFLLFFLAYVVVVPTQNAVQAIFGVFLASYLYYIKVGMGRLPINLSFLCAKLSSFL